ncbi:hypothetical protein DASB73_035650 [Starmerella bacillaris]|uniref:Obg-like ATPase homolog n=1 Tax=Starmerella bacillaris TaxID=1247836 RepID=A0AAV5RN88_STABA|nr:hypothetical protein DASB73_035650 [Starmerella bacillaris]
MFTKTSLTGGIVGLANVGKSTFFQAITKSNLGNPANYPFATIDPEEARVSVPSPRLDTLSEICKPNKVIPTQLTVFDIAGLVKGASKGDGLGNAFLSNIRAVNGLIQMVRVFDDHEIDHIEKTVNPVRDAQIVQDELILKDMEIVLGTIDHLSNRKQRSKENDEVLAVCNKIIKVLDEGKKANTIDESEWKDSDYKHLRKLNLLTMKPSVYVANISEEDYCFGDPNALVADLKQWIQHENSFNKNKNMLPEIVPVSVNFESRLSKLSPEEQMMELKTLESKSALPQVMTTLRRALGLQSFFTVGKQEVREWTVLKGSTPVHAAGVIHEDLAKTFITASVINYDTYVENEGNESALKRLGKVMAKGKDYILQDGDILHIHSAGARKK